MSWTVEFHRHAVKDSRNLASAGLKERVNQLLMVVREDPFAPYPPYEKLTGELAGYYSRRINRQHRLVYEVLEDRHVVRVLRMWSHYE